MLRLMTPVTDLNLPTRILLHALAPGEQGLLIGRGDPQPGRPAARMQCAAYPFHISRAHAVISALEAGGYQIRDAGSLNGTYVNAVRLAAEARHTLRTGDTVFFGGSGVFPNGQHNPYMYIFDGVVADPPTEAADAAALVGDHIAAMVAENLRQHVLHMMQNAAAQAPVGPPPPFVVPEPAALPSEAAAPEQLVAAIADWSHCAVCFEVMVAPHALPNCEHAFCGTCIHTWLERQKTCPTCRAPANPPSYNKILDNVLAATVVPTMSVEAREARLQREEEWHGIRHRVTESRKRRRQDVPVIAVQMGPPPRTMMMHQARMRAILTEPTSGGQWGVRYSIGRDGEHIVCRSCTQPIGLGHVEAVNARANRIYHARCVQWFTARGRPIPVLGAGSIRTEDCGFLIR